MSRFRRRPTAATELLVYTALEADQLKAYEAAFEAANPDVDVQWVRDSTGIITAKLLAEKGNPQADVVMGLAATSLMLLQKEGMLMPYAPAGLADIKPLMRDPADAPSWVGMDVWSSALCFNTVEAEAKGLPKPASWADLTKPEYKGQVVMPNPASSGTGYLMVSAWLQLMGEEKGWAFMDKLHQNVAAYTHSGSKPCKQAAAGEYIDRALLRIPRQRLEGGRRPDRHRAALRRASAGTWKRPASWRRPTMPTPPRSSPTGRPPRRPTSSTPRTTRSSRAPASQPKLEFVPGDVEAMLIKNDFTWAAENRERILAEWTKRFDTKSEPQS